MKVWRAFCSIEVLVTSIIKVRRNEPGLVQEGILDPQVLQRTVDPRRLQIVCGVIYRVVSNQMIGESIDDDSHSFLKQTVVFEVVRIYQRSNEAATDRLTPVLSFLSSCLFNTLLCPPLPAPRKRLIELAVDQEIGKDSTRTPGKTVPPSLDARACLVADKHVSTDNQAVPLMSLHPAGAEWKVPIETSFEDE